MIKQFKQLLNDHASTLLETVLTLPLLIIASLMLIQLGLNFWVLSAQQQATSEALRQFSLGHVDDETNGTLTPCEQLTGMTESGKPSVENWLCQRLAQVPGHYAISADDGYPANISPAGSTLTINTSVDTSSLLLFDLQGLLGALTAQHTKQQRVKE